MLAHRFIIIIVFILHYCGVFYYILFLYYLNCVTSNELLRDRKIKREKKKKTLGSHRRSCRFHCRTQAASRASHWTA